MDNPKAEVRNHPKYGIGVFAKSRILKGEEVASFDGKEYTGYFNHEMAPEILNHGIQVAKNKVRNSDGIARLINHSCDPNCGVKDRIRIVAMRDIEAGEEILWDYEMAENAEWKMFCSCGAKQCRRVVMAYRYLPQEFRDAYEGYISSYLLEEEIPVLPLPEDALEGHPDLKS